MRAASHPPPVRAVASPARIDSPASVSRPYAWIAAIAFTAGFWGYIALAPLLAR